MRRDSHTKNTAEKQKMIVVFHSDDVVVFVKVRKLVTGEIQDLNCRLGTE
jgi:hypothetical protein